MRTVKLPSGATVPALGQGTWKMGESKKTRAQEANALRLGLDLGMTLVDTAEMYAEGGAEEVVAEAVEGRRDKCFIVSKVLPQNASRKGTVEAAERSLKRLRTDRIDLYLLHWRGSHPLAETLAAFQELKAAGKILSYGVSNFDVKDLEEWFALGGGNACETNQVLYNLKHRGPEFDLLPWQAARRMPLMAYSPLEIGLLARSAGVQHVARRHNATPMQIALAFVLRDPHVFTIPKSANPEHVRQNRAAADIRLGPDDLNDLNHASPPPRKKQPLEIA
jgi:diketogulonate reductase-like aldo/keto reductase